jgi:hypothetical protein
LTASRFEIAQRCFLDHPPSPEGERLAQYWLSLWRGDELPLRADFQPRRVADLLPNIVIFDVVPEKSVHCRLAGSFIVEGAGRDITGCDWLALTKPEERSERLKRFSDVARGAIGRGIRQVRRASGNEQSCEEIMLPFRDLGANGSRQVLSYIGWQPTVFDPTIRTIANTGGLLREFRLTAFDQAVKTSGEDGSPSGMVQRLQQGERDTNHP